MFSKLLAVEMKGSVSYEVAVMIALVPGIFCKLELKCYMIVSMSVAAQFAMAAVERRPCSPDSPGEVDVARIRSVFREDSGDERRCRGGVRRRCGQEVMD